MTPLTDRPEITTVLWDLDGTLIRMHRTPFRALMLLLAGAAFADTVPPWRLTAAMGRILPGVRANTGVCSNDELLRALIAEHTGCSPALVDRRLRWLSGRAFPLLWWCFRPQRGARELVAHLAGRGVRQVLATNPLWPRQTVLSRADWGGIDVAHFDYITAGENMTRSKPRTEYYRELLDKLGVQPHECLMIGNDARNDAPASRLGIAVYLIGSGSSGSSGLSDGAVRGAEPVLLTTGSWSALPAWLGV